MNLRLTIKNLKNIGESNAEYDSLGVANYLAIILGFFIISSLDLAFYIADPVYYKVIIQLLLLFLPVLVIVYFINRNRSYFLAGLILNLLITLHFFLLSGVFFGKESGLHYYFLLLSLIPLLTFKSTRVTIKFVLMTINVSCFLYVQYIKPADDFLLIFPESWIGPFRNISIILLFSMMVLIILVNQTILYNKERKLQKQAEEISEKNRELAAINASKDRFFSIIAHDLRGPVGTISTFLGYLADTTNNLTNAQFSESLEVLKRSSQDIYNLLENLLTWSRIQYGNIDFNRQKINLAELIDANITLFGPVINQKRITLINETTDKDNQIYADKDMINTVLRNLLNNALKFTNNGGQIAVSVKKLEKCMLVSVTDNGIGMKKETIDNLFKIEVKQNNILGTNGEKGTGLGLILCKQFVERHGGQILIKSEHLKGSEFSFTIPFSL